MESITLSIKVDREGKTYLKNSGQQICIVRELVDPTDYIVISAVFEPFGDQTDVIFYPSWKIYAMQGALTVGSSVKAQISSDIDLGQQYTFDGIDFTKPDLAYSDTVFGIDNQTPNPICGGILQKVNLTNADQYVVLSVMDLPFNEASYFEPTDTIELFISSGFTQGSIQPSALIQATNSRSARSIGKGLSIELSQDTVIHFDNQSHTFVKE